MKFELSTLSAGDKTVWAWRGTVQGECVMAGPQFYASEREARSGIAKARKACAGAKFAKVVPAEPEVSGD